MKRLLLIMVVICLLLTGCGNQNDLNDDISNEESKEDIKEPEEPVEEKKISIIDMSSNSRPYAVVINNYISATKVQTGLNEAYIIYEFPIEGGITRSLALFKDKTDVKIGTVRSARQNYIDYVMENDAIFVHFGWNIPAKEDISEYKIEYIDGNSRDNKAFKREKNGLATEHTVYTNISTIISHNKNTRKFRTTTDVKPPLHYVTDIVDLSKYEDSVVANNVKVNYASYNVEFKYNTETKRYERYVKGNIHKDYVTGAIYDTKNILVISVGTNSIKEYTDTAGTNYLNIKNIGSGSGYYVTNGYARKITWKKETRKSQTIYKYEDGSTVNINDGNTYIMFQPTNQKINIK